MFDVFHLHFIFEREPPSTAQRIFAILKSDANRIDASLEWDLGEKDIAHTLWRLPTNSKAAIPFPGTLWILSRKPQNILYRLIRGRQKWPSHASDCASIRDFFSFFTSISIFEAHFWYYHKFLYWSCSETKSNVKYWFFKFYRFSHITNFRTVFKNIALS